jgi:hypothetical protein
MTNNTTHLALAGLHPVPTTKVLAIGQLAAPLTPDQGKLMRPPEVPATVRLYLEGKIDQWWFRQDAKGVVFLMNGSSAEEAGQWLDTLPLVQAKLLTFRTRAVGSVGAAACPPGRESCLLRVIPC